MITPAQCQDARKLLGWSCESLSAQTGVSHSTIWRIAAVGKAPLNSWFIESIQRAFEEAGIEFTNSGEAGVRLRQQEMR